MARFSLMLSLAFAACGVSAFPQRAPNSGNGSEVALPKSVIETLELHVVSGDDSADVVQVSNSSLVEAQPEMASEAAADLESSPDPASNLTKRDTCPGGFVGQPVTPWTNVLLVANEVCNYWFPPNNVYWLPVPIDPERIITVPLGPGFPTLEYSLRTDTSVSVAPVFTPMTNTLCMARFAHILNVVTNSINCPPGIYVHDGTDCDVPGKAACFSFEVL